MWLGSPGCMYTSMPPNTGLQFTAFGAQARSCFFEAIVRRAFSDN
jgi:hypothetical protein